MPRKYCRYSSRIAGLVGALACRLPEIRLHRSLELDGHGVAVAVLGVTRGDTDPSLADAVFLDVGLLDTLEADADPALEELGVVVGTVGVGGQPVGGRIVRHCGNRRTRESLRHFENLVHAGD